MQDRGRAFGALGPREWPPRNLLEQLKPSAADTVFEHSKSGHVAARPLQALDKAATDRGGLLSYGPDSIGPFRQAAGMLIAF
jgi:hypothetical protein